MSMPRPPEVFLEDAIIPFGPHSLHRLIVSASNHMISDQLDRLHWLEIWIEVELPRLSIATGQSSAYGPMLTKPLT
jgi:hypothetical protein